MDAQGSVGDPYNKPHGKKGLMTSLSKLTLLVLLAILTLARADLIAADAAHPKQAVAVLNPSQGNKCQGTVRFTEEGSSVKVVADLQGLTPGQKHAMHIHQFGDCSAPDGMSAGGHYNPEGHQHGLPEKDMRHAGDLGNVQADDQGKAHHELTVNNISIAGVKNPILGRAVIVHAKPDDGGQPVGNAGGRIACGAIGVANTGEKK